MKLDQALYWRRLLPLAAGALALVCGMLIAWEGAVPWVKHGEAIEDWSEEASHASVEIADTVSSALGAMDTEIETGLMPLATALLVDPASKGQVLIAFRQRLGRGSLIRVVAVFGSDGGVIATTDPSLDRPQMTVRSRDFFQALQGGETRFTTASYLVGPVLERAAPRMLVLSTHRLTTPDGRFGGVLVAGIDADSLLRVRLDPSLFLGLDARLLDEGGKVLAVHHGGADKVGQNVGGNELFARLGEPMPLMGVLPDPFAGDPEIAVLRRVGATRFLVSVKSENGPDLRPDWWRPVAMYTGGGVVLIVVGAWLLSRGLGADRWLSPSDDAHEDAR